MPVKRPILRYHGGKWKLAPWIISFFPKHRIYVEPFGGAASVLIRKNQSFAEIYNELDGEVWNVFNVLRNPETAEALHRQLGLTPYSRKEFIEAFNGAGEAIEKARRTIVKLHMGFGNDSLGRSRHGGMRTRATVYPSTGFRADAKRRGSTPANDWANYPQSIEAFTQRLKGVVLECRPAVEVIEQHDSVETLFYVDPPYLWSTRSTKKSDRRQFKSYRHELDEAGHRDLARVLHSVRGMVVLSGYPCDLYDRELYPSWLRVERQHFADGARKRTEVVWINKAAETGLSQQTMFNRHGNREEECPPAQRKSNSIAPTKSPMVHSATSTVGK